MNSCWWFNFMEKNNPNLHRSDAIIWHKRTNDLECNVNTRYMITYMKIAFVCVVVLMIVMCVSMQTVYVKRNIVKARAYLFKLKYLEYYLHVTVHKMRPKIVICAYLLRSSVFMSSSRHNDNSHQQQTNFSFHLNKNIVFTTRFFFCGTNVLPTNSFMTTSVIMPQNIMLINGTTKRKHTISACLHRSIHTFFGTQDVTF